MEQMVIVRYHGVKLGVNPDGSPKLLPSYSCGPAINVDIGGYTDPIPMSEALRLKNDFGPDAFEIVAEANMPTTKEEAEEIEAAIESGDAITVAEDLLPLHIEETEVKEQEAEIAATETSDIHVMHTSKKESFDKTVKPVKYTKKALGRMKKAKLTGLFKAYAATSNQVVKPKLRPDMTRIELIESILEMQG